MKIAVLSDLHLGRRNGLDRFSRVAGAEERLERRLSALEASHDHVVLLGDVFETLRGWRPGASRRELRGILKAYPSIARRLETDRFVLVAGNHDPVTRTALNAHERWEVVANGVRLLFIHGHQFDWENRYAPLSQGAVWLGGVLERARVPVTHTVDTLRKRPRHGPEDVTERESAALSYALQSGADVVVTGHTHRAIRHEREGVVYLNSGSWLTGRYTWVDIDTEQRRYEVQSD